MPVADERVDTILHRLRDHGGRVTMPRRLVVEAMVASGDHHLTAGQVFEAVRRAAPDFHESTVYRTLDRLAELGAVEQLSMGAGPLVYHLPQRSHHHLVCDSCGSVTEVPGDLLDDVAARVHKKHGFRLRPEASALHGLCKQCQAAPSPSSPSSQS